MYVKLLGQKLPYYEARHMVRPGLTGWAQIKHGYASDEDDAREKLQYDLHYLRRQSVALDIRILVRTVRTVLLGTGR
jgi:lipopolysaccharide/colanic/teichoic acid biosynthesis glycosyltransferase